MVVVLMVAGATTACMSDAWHGVAGAKAMGEDGKPDGDRMSNRIQLSVKDAHWLSATLMLELTADMDADTLWAMKVAYVS